MVWTGISSSTISRWTRAGRLHRLYRGVYAVGHKVLTDEGRLMAAALAYGDGAFISHDSAGYLWGYSPTCPPFVHVTIIGYAGRAKREGIVLHHSTNLIPADTTRRHNIPVTKPARTRLDLGYDRAPTKSDLERLFLRICREHSVPQPEANPRVGKYRPDFLWRDARLIVEIDSYRYHSNRAAFRADRARDRYFGARGLTVLRFVDVELEEEAASVARTVLARLPYSSQE